MWLCGPLRGLWADVGTAPGGSEDQGPSSRRISIARRTVSRPTWCSCWSCFTDGRGLKW